MTDELKSAYERALEKLKEQGIAEPVDSVTEEQKSQIVNIKNLFKSKIAELEISKQGSTAKAISAQNFEELEKIQQNFVSERARLEEEMERELDKVRRSRA
jgi:hypothetical protein